MFRNQYFVTNFEADVRVDFQCRIFDDLSVYCSPTLGVSHERCGNSEVLVLGYIIDPLNPQKDNDQVVSSLVNAAGIEDVVRRTQHLSGRYVVLFRNDDIKIAFSDTLGHRQVYYYVNNRQLLLTSSPKLFLHVMDFDLKIGDEKRIITESQEFRRNENAWFGDESIDDRLRKVMPNHYIDLNHLQVNRKIFDPLIEGTREGIRDLCGNLLAGAINGAVRRCTVMQAVTAGHDSRILLAASKNYKDKIQYYIFKRPGMDENNPDIDIPSKLSKKLNFNFKILTTKPLRNDFIEVYKPEHIFPRMLSKTQNLQYHYDHNRQQGPVMDIKGNGGEVLRFFYGQSSGGSGHQISPQMLMSLAGYPANKYFTHKIEEWLNDARPFARKHDISIPDLFYWEQRVGNWGAEHGLELDIAVEEFWPFNNAMLLLNGLKIDGSQRSWPRYAFFIELIENLWPEVLSEPINPKHGYLRKIGSYFNGFIKSNAYYENAAKKLARSFHMKR